MPSASDSGMLSPSPSGSSDGSRTWESESGCSEVPDVVDMSEVIEEVSQTDSSSVDHGENEREGDGSLRGGAEIVDVCDGIWVGVGDRERDRS